MNKTDSCHPQFKYFLGQQKSILLDPHRLNHARTSLYLRRQPKSSKTIRSVSNFLKILADLQSLRSLHWRQSLERWEIQKQYQQYCCKSVLHGGLYRCFGGPFCWITQLLRFTVNLNQWQYTALMNYGEQDGKTSEKNRLFANHRGATATWWGAALRCESSWATSPLSLP